MWICLNDAFLSVVSEPSDSNLLKVRARMREHLEAAFPGVPIITTTNSDYAHRVIVTREKVAKLLLDRVGNINYPNFKNSVADNDLHDAYLDMWEAGWRMQQRDKVRKMAAEVARRKRKTKVEAKAKDLLGGGKPAKLYGE